MRLEKGLRDLFPHFQMADYLKNANLCDLLISVKFLKAIYLKVPTYNLHENCYRSNNVKLKSNRRPIQQMKIEGEKL